jgi:prephenate dehydrogenase
MLKENPFALSTLESFAETLNKIISALKKKDYQAFEKLMNANKEKLGKEFIEKQLATAKQVQELLKKE